MFGRMEDPVVACQLVILAARARQIAARIALDETTEYLSTVRIDQALDRWTQIVYRKTLAGQAPDQTH